MKMTPEEFEACFEDCRYSAFRLETLQFYDAPSERGAFARFCADGAVLPSTSQQDWSRIVGAGRRFQRVHVVIEPLTDYVRFEGAGAYRFNTEAGEDVRLLPVSTSGWPGGIPRHDFWLFDSHKLVRMDYDADGVMRTPELVLEPEEIVRANQVRDRALHLAVPYADYTERIGGWT